MSKPTPVYLVPPPTDASGGIAYLFFIGIIWYFVSLFEAPSEKFSTYPSLFFAWVYHYTLYKPLIFLFNCIADVWVFFKNLTPYSNLNNLLAIIFTGLTISLEIAIIYIVRVVFTFYVGVGFIWLFILFVKFLFS